MKPKLKILLLKALHAVCWIVCLLCMCAFQASKLYFFVFFSALFFSAAIWLFDFISYLEAEISKFWVEKINHSEKIKSLLARNKKLHMKKFFPLFIFCCSLLFALTGSIKDHWPFGLLAIAPFIASFYWLRKIKEEKYKIKEAIWQ